MNAPRSDSIAEAVASSAPIEKLSRIGYAACGFVYFVIGILAARLTWGERGAIADPASAIKLMDNEPLGELLVPLISAGLGAYAVWRLVQAISDPDGQGTSPKGVFVRAGRFCSALGYGSLSWFAGRLGAGTASPDSDGSWIGRALADPLGQAGAVVVSIILLVVAADDIRKAATTNYGERFNRPCMGRPEWLISRCAGSWGFAARATVLVFAAWYLAAAVWQQSPGIAKDFEGVIAAMFQLPSGHLLVRFVGLGMAAYGWFMMQAGWRRRHPA